MKKIYEAFIARDCICIIQDIFRLKNITDHKIIRISDSNAQELKLYEAIAGQRLDENDAILISQFTETEVQDLIEDAFTDGAIDAFQSKQTREGIKHYNLHYCCDDPICRTTIDYILPDEVDTISFFSSDYNEIIQNAICDNIFGILKWLDEKQDPFLEFRFIADGYIGTGIVYTDTMIREMQTKDVVLILEKSVEHDFSIMTAYPDISARAETAVPTGQDIRTFIHETDAYKCGDSMDWYLLDQKVLRGMIH